MRIRTVENDITTVVTIIIIRVRQYSDDAHCGGHNDNSTTSHRYRNYFDPS